jgi:hypothetical protein
MPYTNRNEQFDLMSQQVRMYVLDTRLAIFRDEGRKLSLLCCCMIFKIGVILILDESRSVPALLCSIFQSTTLDNCRELKTKTGANSKEFCW